MHKKTQICNRNDHKIHQKKWWQIYQNNYHLILHQIPCITKFVTKLVTKCVTEYDRPLNLSLYLLPNAVFVTKFGDKFVTKDPGGPSSHDRLTSWLAQKCYSKKTPWIVKTRSLLYLHCNPALRLFPVCIVATCKYVYVANPHSGRGSSFEVNPTSVLKTGICWKPLKIRGVACSQICLGFMKLRRLGKVRIVKHVA